MANSKKDLKDLGFDFSMTESVYSDTFQIQVDSKGMIAINCGAKMPRKIDSKTGMPEVIETRVTHRVLMTEASFRELIALSNNIVIPALDNSNKTQNEKN